MPIKLFKEIEDDSLKEYAKDGNYEKYKGIVLDTETNQFKVVSGLFTDKKDFYDKMAKRGLVSRKVFEASVFDWIEKNAKSNLDAYMMFSTAFSKWRGNNMLSDYYVKLLNDIPSLNRERQKGNPNTRGPAKKGWDESVITEDLSDLHPYFTGNVKGDEYIPPESKVKLYLVKDFHDIVDNPKDLKDQNILKTYISDKKPINMEKDIIYNKPLRFNVEDGLKYQNPLFWDTLYQMFFFGAGNNTAPAETGYNGIIIQKEDDPNSIRYIAKGNIKAEWATKGTKGNSRPQSARRTMVTNAQNNMKALQSKDNLSPEEKEELKYWSAVYNSGNFNKYLSPNQKAAVDYLNKEITKNQANADLVGRLVQQRDEIISYTSDRNYIQSINQALLSLDNKIREIQHRDRLYGNNDDAELQRLYKVRYFLEKSLDDEVDRQNIINKAEDEFLANNPVQPANTRNQGDMEGNFLNRVQRRLNAQKKLDKVRDLQRTGKTLTLNKKESAVNSGITQAKIDSFGISPHKTSSGGTLSETEFKKELNPELFENDKLKSDIKEAMLKIAKTFEESLEVLFAPVDIYFTGSNANYNYNEHSDIDLHLVFDFENVGINSEILEQYLKIAKKVFNSKYDITIKGLKVEVGCENINTPLVAGGIYSLLKDEWIKKPEKLEGEIADPDMTCYNHIVNEIEKAIQSKDSNIIGNLWKKLGKMRKESLATEGEFGKGNSLFKELRNNEFLNRLKDAYYESISEELSVESLEDII